MAPVAFLGGARAVGEALLSEMQLALKAGGWDLFTQGFRLLENLVFCLPYRTTTVWHWVAEDCQQMYLLREGASGPKVNERGKQWQGNHKNFRLFLR